MIDTRDHQLRQHSLALEGFLEAHGEVVSAGLDGSTVRQLAESLLADRRRLRAADRRVALRQHEAEVARQRRRRAVGAVRGQMVMLRGLVRALYGPRGPRYLLILRCAISRHPSSLDGQARRAVYALRLRTVEGVRLALLGTEISPAALADLLEPRQLELAAAVTEGFRSRERLVAAQLDRGICQKKVLQHLREVRDTVWRACHRAGKPRLAAKVRRMLARRRRTVVGSPRKPVRGVETFVESPSTAVRGVETFVRSARNELRVLETAAEGPRRRCERDKQLHRASDSPILGARTVVRGPDTSLEGSFAPVRRVRTACAADLHCILASTRAGRRPVQRSGASTPRVRASRHFSGHGLPMPGSERGEGGSRRSGRGPPSTKPQPSPLASH